MLIIGIDPGLEGAVATLDGPRAGVWDTPVIARTAKGKNRRDYDVNNMANMLQGILYGRDPESCRAYLERALSMPPKTGRAGGTSMFQAGLGFGVWLGLLGALHLSHVIVMPTVWKRAVNLLGSDKEASRLEALRLYPAIAPYLARRKDHNRAEALLIAHYGSLRHALTQEHRNVPTVEVPEVFQGSG